MRKEEIEEIEADQETEQEETTDDQDHHHLRIRANAPRRHATENDTEIAIGGQIETRKTHTEVADLQIATKSLEEEEGMEMGRAESVATRKTTTGGEAKKL